MKFAFAFPFLMQISFDMNASRQLKALLVLLLLAASCEAYFKEKKLLKLLLLGAALAPRGFVPIPIPEYSHDHHDQGHHKIIHVHHGHHYGHHGYGHHHGYGF